MDETWEGDEYGEELPVVTGPDADLVPPRRRGWRPVAFQEKTHGTPLPMVPMVRDAAIAEATGKGPPTEEPWRQDLADKKRGRASDALTSRKQTHHADSGFGLAG